MAERWFVLREARVAAVNTWLHNHATLDLRGGGNFTFTRPLNLTADPAGTVRARGCKWDVPDAWEEAIRAEILARGWKVNTTDNDNDLSVYAVSNFTLAQMLADVTRKPAVLKLIPQTP